MKLPLISSLLFALSLSSPARSAESLPLDPKAVAETLTKVADWQLENPNRTSLRDWVIAPLYDGLIDVSEVTGDPKYLAAVIRLGIQADWRPGNSLYFADDHAVGHAWLDIYMIDPSKKERLTPFQARFDAILAKPVTEHLVEGQQPQTPGLGTGDRWSWCDALYMGPPTWARLAKVTGDSRYLDFLDAEYRVTYDDLFDPEENLFFRDARFLDQKTPSGAKVFWSRGNGWVFAGLPMLLEAYPDDRPARKFYTELFQKMAPAVVAAQQPDGLWRPSLLDPEQVPIGESSGSAFFVYGLAWGIENGLLDREEYWPAVERGWQALVKCVGPDGALGFVQRIGDAPDHLDASSQQLYGTGAFLMAGSEILRALGAASDVKPEELLARAEKIVADDKTPRAVASLIPVRDDVAWENDKVAFRVYGPALREGVEASGIDAFAKHVPYPVLGRMYADEAAGIHSYHEDNGEGFDGYKVGDSLGAGGTGIWRDGKLVSADVFDDANILWTRPDELEFTTRYTYPPIDGKTYNEERTVRLRLGEQLNEITSRFTIDGNPAADLTVAVGLMAQSKDASFTMQDDGIMAVWDNFDPGGQPFGIGALVPAGSKMQKIPHDTAPIAEEAIALLATDQNGVVQYKTGSGWAGDGHTDSEKAWLDYLAQSRK